MLSRFFIDRPIFAAVIAVVISIIGIAAYPLLPLSQYPEIAPPTINLDNLDPKCAELGIDFTANKAVEKKMKYALSNSFGFGGTNCTLAFSRYQA